ncbi:MAG: glycosyltransferase family 4 protein [Anaerolineales bacterium]|nr:glycosyltransferase family 4 protein [Anaerolineales bacterium]
MRILLAVHHFPPRYTGGAEWRAHRTARALLARGHVVRVVCVEQIDAPPTAPLTWQDDTYDEVDVRRLSFNLAAAPDPFRWTYDNTWIGEHLRLLIAEFKPDVLHVISGYLISGRALRVAAELGIPSVVTLTDFWFLCPRLSLRRPDGSVSKLPVATAECAQCLGEERRRYRWSARVAPELMRRYWARQTGPIQRIEARRAFLLDSLNQAGAVISPSEFLRSIHIEAGVAPDRIRFSRQGRDFPDLTPELMRKTPSGTLRLGYLGQIAELKGVHVLLEAARRLAGQKLSVTVYGDLEPFPKYSALLKKLAADDPRIRLAGAYRGHAALAQIFPELDAIVVPSLWYENSPNTILEAFAYKTPVIATRLGGMAELVRHGENGLLFESGDADDLSRQIWRLLAEPGLRDRLGSGVPPVRTVAEEIDELVAMYGALTSGAASELAKPGGG